MATIERVGPLRDATSIPRFVSQRERAEGDLRRFRIGHRLHSASQYRYVLAKDQQQAVLHYCGSLRQPGLTEEHLSVTELPD